MSAHLIEAREISKSYESGGHRLRILEGISLYVEQGGFIAIMGPSGSGKSTLLNILGCLDRPDSGSYHFCGQNISTAADNELARLRSCAIGFVFQSFNLVPGLSVLENVELPFLYAPTGRRRKRNHALEAVSRVGLSHRMHHRPSQLSGGEMQRCAIARALAVDPDMILADEPTGNLDMDTGSGILDLLAGLHGVGKTVLMVTHDLRVAGYAKQVLTLENGRLS